MLKTLEYLEECDENKALSVVSLKGQLNDSVRLETEGPISGRVVQGLLSLPLVQEYTGDTTL